MRRALSILIALALVLLLGATAACAAEDASCEDCCESTMPCPATCLACPCGRMVSPLPVEAPSLPPAWLQHVPDGWTEPLPPSLRPHARDVFQPPRG
ncbi:hypothetical protein BO221_34725 [Archangium sp. Cb G35]|uniref:hypothetical protein n=1 Tax=Archangium sp. Cb G35 TaxID=1920190 RepID=UPI000935E0B4|nr:hypothetical protein [Archangium sp. Cb G35]OJT19533.1 hypothetical protein BO221_34725 [Archangium sp. Cb G35]